MTPNMKCCNRQIPMRLPAVAYLRFVAAAATLLIGACAVSTNPPDGNDNGSGSGNDNGSANDNGAQNELPGVWAQAFDAAAFGALSAVWGSGPDDVFMVGGSSGQGKVLHFDGQDWVAVDVPDVPFLTWVFGFSSESVVAVGLEGTVLHYDGQVWTTRVSGTSTDLWGVWGADEENIWIVGGSDGVPVIVRLDVTAPDAAAFSPFSLPNTDRTVDALFNVWGIGNRTFAVGAAGVILEFDASRQRWTQSATGPAANEDFFALWGTNENNIVAVGGQSGGRISVFNGRQWTTQWVSASGPLSAIHMVRSDQAIIGGEGGFVANFDPTRNALNVESSGTEMTVSALWSDGQGKFYGAGGRFVEPFTGAALLRTAGEPGDTPPDDEPPDDGPPDVEPPDDEPPASGATLVAGISNFGIFDDFEDGNIVRLQVDESGQASVLVTFRVEGFAPNAELSLLVAATSAVDGLLIVTDTEISPVSFSEVEPGINEARDLEIVIDGATFEQVQNTDANFAFGITDPADSSVSAVVSYSLFLAPPRSR